MITLMYAAGLRVSELVGLPCASVLKGGSTILVMGKGSKERMLPLVERAAKALKEYLPIRPKFFKKGCKESKFLFPGGGKLGHITRDGFSKLLKQQALFCGIAPAKVSPHVLRHSFASHLLSGGMDLRTLQAMLGHENIATTQIYTHLMSDELQRTVEEKHPLARVKSGSKAPFGQNGGGS
jgi:integrase/recombinase XerD